MLKGCTDRSEKPTAALRQAQGDSKGSEDLQRIAGTEDEHCAVYDSPVFKIKKTDSSFGRMTNSFDLTK